MFNNYTLGVSSSSVSNGVNLPQNDNIVQTVADYTTEDKYGNVVSLNWPPSARFTIALTSDLWAPVAENSIILSIEDECPLAADGVEGKYAYNTHDCRCWKFVSGNWKEETDIIEFKNSNNVILFSTKNCFTIVTINNFRGESIISFSDNSNIVNVTVDDAVSSLLMQGFYNIEIYKVFNGSTKLVKRIPLSVGYGGEFNPSNDSGTYINSGFTTDNSLKFLNGVLSVNTLGTCTKGSTLPVSSVAVYNYAQPKNITLHIEDIDSISDITSLDIYNHTADNGSTVCIYNHQRYELEMASPDTSVFKSSIVEGNAIIHRTISIDRTGKVKLDTYGVSIGVESAELID